MPTIRTFYGIPPHFHAVYAEDEVKIDIRTLEVIEGRMPRRALGVGAGVGTGAPCRTHGGLAAMLKQSTGTQDFSVTIIPRFAHGCPGVWLR